ncbi:hypothetical protein C8D70_11023 [Chryseobacterium sp. CBTAP 102]|nr:hypothetical protein C8D70_11023 [Chryseobacterium sp. CBTAP 102]
MGEETFNKSHKEGTLTTLKWSNVYVIQHEVDFNAVDGDSIYQFCDKYITDLFFFDNKNSPDII